MFVKQTCQYLSQFEEVSARGHTWAGTELFIAGRLHF